MEYIVKVSCFIKQTKTKNALLTKLISISIQKQGWNRYVVILGLKEIFYHYNHLNLCSPLKWKTKNKYHVYPAWIRQVFPNMTHTHCHLQWNQKKSSLNILQNPLSAIDRELDICKTLQKYLKNGGHTHELECGILKMFSSESPEKTSDKTINDYVIPIPLIYGLYDIIVVMEELYFMSQNITLII